MKISLLEPFAVINKNNFTLITLLGDYETTYDIKNIVRSLRESGNSSQMYIAVGETKLQHDIEREWIYLPYKNADKDCSVIDSILKKEKEAIEKYTPNKEDIPKDVLANKYTMDVKFMSRVLRCCEQYIDKESGVARYNVSVIEKDVEFLKLLDEITVNHSL